MMRKIAVFGLPGTGKTTLALRLARLLDVPCHDLDRVLFTQDGRLPLDEFRSRAAAQPPSPRLAPGSSTATTPNWPT